MTTTTALPVAVDDDKLMKFVFRVVDEIGATLNTALVVMGDKLGLYRALAEHGPLTPVELAEWTGVAERYVREWLNAQVAGEFIGYDPSSQRYSLGAEQAVAFTDSDSPAYLPGFFQIALRTVVDAPRIIEAAHRGAGVGWHEHVHDVFEGCERFFRPGYNANLISDWLPALDGVVAKLERGASVADVGCGHGSSTILMARAYPGSNFVGSDYHDGSIETARLRAREAGVDGRVRFEVTSAADYRGSGYDLVTNFDCLHDMGDPVGAARHVRETIAPDGTWMIVEPRAGDRVEDNINPVSRAYYGFSTLLCTPASLSQEVGLALGAQAGEARIRDVVTSAGLPSLRGSPRRRSTWCTRYGRDQRGRPTGPDRVRRYCPCARSSQQRRARSIGALVNVTIADRLHAAVESGAVSAFASDYAPDARLEARLAGHEVVADGRDNIIAELSIWWSASSRLDYWDVAASDGGLRVMLEWSTGDDRTRDRSAQVHLIHLVDGLINRHYVFCVHPKFGPAPYLAGPTPSFLRGALRREPLRHGDDSGSHLERVVLADGSPAIVKHISPKWDWIMRATRDSGREAELWHDGTLQGLPGIDYPVIAVEQEGDGWAIALRDVSAALIPAGTELGREDVRRLLQALDRMHRHFAHRDVPGLCSLADRAYIFSPGVARAEYQSSFRIPRIVGCGWELFADVVGDNDLTSVILRLTEDPSPLVAELERGGTTLLHGDFCMNENSGLTSAAVVAIDWAMACRGPAEIEFSYFLQNWSQPYGLSREDVIDEWRSLRGDDFDPRLLQLALLFEVVIKGWGWAYATTLSPDPVDQATDIADLRWWLDQARRALELWSP